MERVGRTYYVYILASRINGTLYVGVTNNLLRRTTEHREHLLKGFTRFSEIDGVLVGEIEPKNRVLPLLRPHFCARYPGENFVLHDRTHREVLLHRPGRWAIVPAEDFRPGAPGEAERQYRRLWRRFYDTIAIEGRYNPRCRMTQMPKRYWGTMTEFQREEAERKELTP